MLTKHLVRQGQNLLKQRVLLRNAPIFVRSESNFEDGGEHCTMNDLPIPEGDWHEWYTKKNSRYNMVLGSSVIALITSIIMFKNCKQVIFNYSVPDYVPD